MNPTDPLDPTGAAPGAVNPIAEFARLDSTPLVSPISLRYPGNRPYTPPDRSYPRSTAAPAGYQGGIDPEHNFFPDPDALEPFLPAGGVMDGSELIAGGNVNPPPRALDTDGSGNTTGPEAATPAEKGPGLAEALRLLNKEGHYDEYFGLNKNQRKYSDKFLEKRDFDEDVRAQVGLIPDNIDRGRHKGGLVTDAQTGALEPGTETDMALLEGEFVVTRQAVEMFGVEFLDQLNAAAAAKLGQDADAGPGGTPAVPPAAPPTGNGPLDQFASMI